VKSKAIISLGFGLALAVASILPAAAASTTSGTKTGTKMTSSTPAATHKAAPVKKKAPAKHAHHTHYYVAHNKSGKGCSVTTTRPKMMAVKYYYETHKEAEAALKHAKACH